MDRVKTAVQDPRTKVSRKSEALAAHKFDGHPRDISTKESYLLTRVSHARDARLEAGRVQWSGRVSSALTIGLGRVGSTSVAAAAARSCEVRSQSPLAKHTSPATINEGKFRLTVA